VRVSKGFLIMVSFAFSRGLPIDIDALFYGLKPQAQRDIEGKRRVMGCELYLAGLRLADGELFMIVTNELPDDAIKTWQTCNEFISIRAGLYNKCSYESILSTEPI
jgi:hypothetical protein